MAYSGHAWVRQRQLSVVAAAVRCCSHPTATTRGEQSVRPAPHNATVQTYWLVSRKTLKPVDVNAEMSHESRGSQSPRTPDSDTHRPTSSGVTVHVRVILQFIVTIYDDTIQYDVVYLTCSKKLTCSQLSPPHGTNRKITEKKLKINREAW